MVVYIKLEIKEAQRLGASVTVQLSYHPVNRFVLSCYSDYFSSQAICWLERLSVISLHYETVSLIRIDQIIAVHLLQESNTVKNSNKLFG